MLTLYSNKKVFRLRTSPQHSASTSRYHAVLPSRQHHSFSRQCVVVYWHRRDCMSHWPCAYSTRLKRKRDETTTPFNANSGQFNTTPTPHKPCPAIVILFLLLLACTCYDVLFTFVAVILASPSISWQSRRIN